jgi:hypothetical protein
MAVSYIRQRQSDTKVYCLKLFRFTIVIMSGIALEISADGNTSSADIHKRLSGSNQPYYNIQPLDALRPPLIQYRVASHTQFIYSVVENGKIRCKDGMTS